MQVVHIIVFFMICWWMVFYIMLPIGVKDDENRITGQASSAPRNPYIKRKIIIASVVTVIITLIFFTLVSSQ